MPRLWIGLGPQPTLSMTTALLVVLMLCILYLIIRVRQLEYAVAVLARIVNKPRRRDRALRREVKALESDLDYIRNLAVNGAADPEDFERPNVIREKLDRRLRAHAGRPRTSESPSVRPKS